MVKKIDDLDILKLSEEICDEIWKKTENWGYFERKTVGQQLVRATDSIGANISESFGRYHYGEKLKFLYYSRGSLFETKYWLKRCKSRHLLDDPVCDALTTRLDQLHRKLNGFIAHIRQSKLNRAS